METTEISPSTKFKHMEYDVNNNVFTFHSLGQVFIGTETYKIGRVYELEHLLESGNFENFQLTKEPIESNPEKGNYSHWEYKIYTFGKEISCPAEFIYPGMIGLLCECVKKKGEITILFGSKPDYKKFIFTKQQTVITKNENIEFLVGYYADQQIGLCIEITKKIEI